MSERPLRVAFFPDTFDEVDGVANTSRQFEAFARRNEFPFLTIHGGHHARQHQEGSTERITLPRSPMGFPLDTQHGFDLLFGRYLQVMEAKVQAFDADVVHITGPSDAGMLGMAIAHRLSIPLAASWHTNLHQYAEQRSAGLLRLLPKATRGAVGHAICRTSLLALQRFYGFAQVLFAPNQELQTMLEDSTKRPCRLMHRGVDTVLFDPARRTRSDETFVIGYVGRLSPEKSVRDLVQMEAALEQAGVHNFRFVVIGQGVEKPWLEANLRRADFAGVLRGEALAQAFANMDVLAFPSRTDTFGNVVLEALASGVPAIVTDSGGPRFLVDAGRTGFIARNTAEFTAHITTLARQPQLRAWMSQQARTRAMESSWNAVFHEVYGAYESGLRSAAADGKRVRRRRTNGVAVGHSS